MHFIVAPASAKTAQAAIRRLLDDTSKPTVTGYYRDLKKVPTDLTKHSRFTAKVGDVSDGSSLDFSGADAVMTLSPPKYDGSDLVAFARDAAQNIKSAAKKAGVQRVVYVSSGGAQLDKGVGEIATNHEAEMALSDAASEVVFVRGAYFMQNWMMVMATLKEDPPFINSVITPLDHKVPMVSNTDIGATCAQQLLATGDMLSRSPYAFELYGPRDYSPQDVGAAFSKALGKQVEVRPVEPHQLRSFFGGIFPPNVADMFEEMTLTLRPGGLLEEGYEGREIRRAGVPLDEAIAQLVGHVGVKSEKTTS